jgi:hypothetical protein
MPAPATIPPTAPSVRARFLQRWLQNVSREDDPWRARFFAAVPSDVQATIERAARDAWLPAAWHVLLADILRDAFGPARAHEYYRHDFVRSLRRPPFASLVTTGARVLGLTPGSFLRWSGRVYETVFRGCGAMHGEVRAPGLGRLVYEGLPAVFTASDAWLDSSQGSMYGIYDFLGTTGGVVRIDKSRRAEGRLQLELEWTP